VTLSFKEYIAATIHLARKNPIVAFLTVGLVWLLFFDRDSVMYQLKINREIKQLERENLRLERQIDSTKKMLEKMNDPEFLERYAREQLLLRKANEDIYLIDTTQYDK